jgi:hypothetical protein
MMKGIKEQPANKANLLYDVDGEDLLAKKRQSLKQHEYDVSHLKN